PARGLAVEPLCVPRLQCLDVAVHVNLDETALGHERTYPIAVSTVWRHERADHDTALLEEQPCNLADAPNVLGAVRGRKSQIAAEPMAHLVSIKEHGVAAIVEEPTLQQPRDAALAAAGQ